MYLGIKCPLKSLLKIHFFKESFPDIALQIMFFCSMNSKQAMLFIYSTYYISDYTVIWDPR